jgi:hypothetical protein
MQQTDLGQVERLHYSKSTYHGKLVVLAAGSHTGSTYAEALQKDRIVGAVTVLSCSHFYLVSGEHYRYASNISNIMRCMHFQGYSMRGHDAFLATCSPRKLPNFRTTACMHVCIKLGRNLPVAGTQCCPCHRYQSSRLLGLQQFQSFHCLSCQKQRRAD